MTLQDPPTALLELGEGNRFEYLFPEGSNEYLRQISEGMSPTAGEDIWAIGIVVKDPQEGIVGQEETELEYEPRGAKRLKKDYRRSYRDLVIPLQDMHESEDDLKTLEEKILLNAVENMSHEGLRLLGGFCVARGKEPGQIFPAIFYSKTLSSCYSRVMRETSLAVDLKRDIPPELEVTEEDLELFAKAANLEHVNEFSIACGGIVASLLPHPATVSPTFGQGPKPTH